MTEQIRPFVFALSFVMLVLLAGCGGDTPSPVPPTPPVVTPTEPVAKVKVGSPALPEMGYKWDCVPKAQISDVYAAQPVVTTKVTTTCTVTVTTKCGVAKSSMTINVSKAPERQ